jgi:hypothetical protein
MQFARLTAIVALTAIAISPVTAQAWWLYYRGGW